MYLAGKHPLAIYVTSFSRQFFCSPATLPLFVKMYIRTDFLDALVSFILFQVEIMRGCWA
jgi:hypothetical protein